MEPVGIPFLQEGEDVNLEFDNLEFDKRRIPWQNLHGE